MSYSFLKRKFLSVIDKYLKGESTPEEDKLVDYFYDNIKDENISHLQLETIKKEIKLVIDERIETQSENLKKRNTLLYIKIAASIIFLTSFSFYFLDIKKSSSNVNIKINSHMPIVSLNNGQKYSLEDTLRGKLSYKIVENERIYILADSMFSKESKLLKIYNPTNKIFAFLLDDGTIAWLNPNSNLEILPDENGKRMVKISGTVLFNVQKIKESYSYKPFVVKTELQTIEVLGTKFIINSKDGKTEDILLLEGKVKLTHNKFYSEVILSPNQKASLKNNEANILITKSSEGYKVDAWRKALFHFESEKMGDVMAEIAQWYKKDIIVDEAIKDIPITGIISRYKNINEVLEIISLTNNVEFHKKGEYIYVK